MARQERYHWVGVNTYAKLKGVSVRTARRQLASNSNAHKTSKGWRIAITNSQYAKATGKSPRTTRRTGILATSPSDLRLEAQLPQPPSREKKLVPTNVRPEKIVLGSGYQYQGWAIIRFVNSGDTIRVYSSRIPSPSALTYKQLDLAIRRDIYDRFMRSPIEILKTGILLSRCYRSS